MQYIKCSSGCAPCMTKGTNLACQLVSYLVLGIVHVVLLLRKGSLCAFCIPARHIGGLAQAPLLGRRRLSWLLLVPRSSSRCSLRRAALRQRLQPRLLGIARPLGSQALQGFAKLVTLPMNSPQTWYRIIIMQDIRELKIDRLVTVRTLAPASASLRLAGDADDASTAASSSSARCSSA